MFNEYFHRTLSELLETLDDCEEKIKFLIISECFEIVINVCNLAVGKQRKIVSKCHRRYGFSDLGVPSELRKLHPSSLDCPLADTLAVRRRYFLDRGLRVKRGFEK